MYHPSSIIAVHYHRVTAPVLLEADYGTIAYHFALSAVALLALHIPDKRPYLHSPHTLRDTRRVGHSAPLSDSRHPRRWDTYHRLDSTYTGSVPQPLCFLLLLIVQSPNWGQPEPHAAQKITPVLLIGGLSFSAMA